MSDLGRSSFPVGTDVFQSEAALPPLYQSWLHTITAGPIPAETRATCDNCAMLPEGDELHANQNYFHPATKCCSIRPRLANFLAGRILSDNDPSFAAGQQQLEKFISDRIGITPLSAGPAQPFAFVYAHTPNASERSAEARCHFLTSQGACGIWAHRPAPCATWFCKHVRGRTGLQFWRIAGKLLLQVEQNLALWCATQLKSGLTGLCDRDATIVAHLPELGGELNPDLYQRVWGAWAGRELDFYRACARLVDPLSWEQVQNICSPGLAILALLLHDAYIHLKSDAIPDRLRLTEVRIQRVEAGAAHLTSYSSLDPLSIPEPLTHVLHYFDGRPTDEILTTILLEHNLRIDPSMLRRMLDFGILQPCDPQQLFPILKSA